MFKNIAMTAATAALFALPMSAGAVTFLDASDSGTTIDILSDDLFQFNETFSTGDAAGTLDFTFENTSDDTLLVVLSSATINQLGAASFFEGGATVAWDNAGLIAAAAQGVQVSGSLTFNLAAGASDTLVLDFGGAFGAPDIDFQVAASPVPLPAGMVLMGTAIAGFGVARRRKKS